MDLRPQGAAPRLAVKDGSLTLSLASCSSAVRPLNKPADIFRFITDIQPPGLKSGGPTLEPQAMDEQLLAVSG